MNSSRSRRSKRWRAGRWVPAPMIDDVLEVPPPAPTSRTWGALLAMLAPAIGAIALLVFAAMSTSCVPLHGADLPQPRPSIDSSRTALSDRIHRDVALIDDTTLALRFDPPPIFAAWRAAIQHCSGRVRAGAPTLWVAQRPEIRPNWLALYARRPRMIVFGLGHEAVDWIAMHELLHDELDDLAHDPEYFDGRCRELVRPRGSP